MIGSINMLPIFTSEKKILSYLVHTSVGEQESRIIVRDSGRRRYKHMTVIFKVLDKGGTHLVSRPLSLSSHIRLVFVDKGENRKERCQKCWI